MSTDNDIYECECWDPRNKWETQDVFNHMEEALDLMLQCFKVNPEEQQYQLDVGRKVKEIFQSNWKSRNQSWTIL